MYAYLQSLLLLRATIDGIQSAGTEADFSLKLSRKSITESELLSISSFCSAGNSFRITALISSDSYSLALFQQNFFMSGQINLQVQKKD